MVLFVDACETWAVHLLAGGARVADASGRGRRGAGDTAILRAGGERVRHVLDGAGEVLLARLQSRSG
jgi:hypothetical protein